MERGTPTSLAGPVGSTGAVGAPGPRGAQAPSIDQKRRKRRNSMILGPASPQFLDRMDSLFDKLWSQQTTAELYGQTRPITLDDLHNESTAKTTTAEPARMDSPTES